MRKIVWGFAAIIVASLIVVACQKEAGSPQAANAPFDAKAAKEWYYGTYKKTPEWASYNAQTSGKRLPGWDKGIERKIGKLDIVEFPFVKEKNSFRIVSRGELQPESKRKIAEAAFSRVLFIKYPSGAIQVREMQYIPDMDYMARHQYDASSNSFGDIDADFSGTIVANKWNGEEVSRKILKNGKITASFKTDFIKRASLTESCPIGTVQVDEYERDCESHLYGDGMLTYQCGAWYATGNQWCIGEEEINEIPDCTTPNSPECSCTLTGGCDDPGGGEQPDEEIGKYADLEWDVYFVPEVNGGGLVMSTERFYAKFNSNRPENDRFTGGNHLNNRLVANYNGGTFVCDTWGVTINSPTQATAVCAGEITFSDGVVLSVNKTKPVALNSLYWQR